MGVGGGISSTQCTVSDTAVEDVIRRIVGQLAVEIEVAVQYKLKRQQCKRSTIYS